MREMINFIEKVKNGVKSKKYNSKDELKKDFYKVRKHMWRDIDTNNLNESDLSDISDIHDYLIDKVCKTHELEESQYNEEILNSNLNLKDLEISLDDGKRARNIYSFTDEDYDYYFIGDLHSDTISLKRILNVCDFFEAIISEKNIRLIFLGDYIDRGKAHLEIIEFILLLKYIFPSNIYLLSGNHDGGKFEGENIKLCVGRNRGTTDDDYFILFSNNLSQYNKTFKQETVKNYIKFFNSLCNIAIVNYNDLKILAVHGGIPRPQIDLEEMYQYIKVFSDLTNEYIIDSNNRSIKHNMLWSDPCEDFDESYLKSGRFKFSREHFLDFMDKVGLDILLRGHQAEKEGVKEYFNSRLFTLFSSGMILNGNNENINTETAYEDIAPKIFKLGKGRKTLIVDLNK